MMLALNRVLCFLPGTSAVAFGAPRVHFRRAKLARFSDQMGYLMPLLAIVEFGHEADGQVVKYSLADVNGAIRGPGNGRVWGYRHSMGKQESFEFHGYEALARQFFDEVRELWRKENEKRRKGH